ncbi:hypothetical protein BJV74DRAFT_887734 [Russula compacta]|nr:hypothetical protein BJV74DRAFT_887734 [Russula compacta]
MAYRNDNSASYDRTLLSSVPDPTRAEKQEGYNLDLLDEGRDRRAPTPPDSNSGPPQDQQQGTTVGYSPGAVGYARKEGLENGHGPVVAKVPWYRTKWGIIGIVVVLVLIIGGVVGGAVGGTQHSSHKSTTAVEGQGQSQSQNPNNANATQPNTSEQPEGVTSVGSSHSSSSTSSFNPSSSSSSSNGGLGQ